MPPITLDTTKSDDILLTKGPDRVIPLLLTLLADSHDFALIFQRERKGKWIAEMKVSDLIPIVIKEFVLNDAERVKELLYTIVRKDLCRVLARRVAPELAAWRQHQFDL